MIGSRFAQKNPNSRPGALSTVMRFSWGDPLPPRRRIGAAEATARPDDRAGGTLWWWPGGGLQTCRGCPSTPLHSTPPLSTPLLSTPLHPSPVPSTPLHSTQLSRPPGSNRALCPIEVVQYSLQGNFLIFRTLRPRPAMMCGRCPKRWHRIRLQRIYYGSCTDACGRSSSSREPIRRMW